MYIHVLIIIVVIVACFFVSYARGVGAVITIALANIVITIADVTIVITMKFTVIITMVDSLP